MKKFLSAVIENVQPFSQKLLFGSFISGYILAIIFFKLYGPHVHQFIESLFQGL